MSTYRATDAFSRRPSGDDHRDDRREDRERREDRRDDRREVRERREDRDRGERRIGNASPRDRISPPRDRATKTTAPVATGRTHESAKPATKPSQAVATPAPPIPDALAEEFAALLKKYESAIAEKAKLLNQWEFMDKAAKRGERDYQPYKDKHPDHSGPAELLSHHLQRDNKERKDLKAKISQNSQNLDKLRDDLSRKFAYATSQAAAAHPPPNKDLEGNVTSLRTALKQLQNESNESKKEHADMRKALVDQIAALQTQFQKQLNEHKAELQTQLEKQFEEHKAENVASQAEGVKRALEAQRAESAPSEDALRAELTKLWQAEFSKLQSENAALSQKLSETVAESKERDQQRDEQVRQIQDLAKQVTALSQRPTETVEESKERDQQRDQQWDQQIQKLQTAVDAHEGKLYGIDWNTVQQALVRRLPLLEKEVKELQAMVKGLPDLEEKVEELRGTQQQLPGPAVATLDMSVIDTKLGENQKKVEQKVGKKLAGALAAVGGYVDELRTKDESQQRELTGLHERTALLVKRIDETEAALSKHMTKTEEAQRSTDSQLRTNSSAIGAVDEKLSKRMDVQQFQAQVLDTRFNNLTTQQMVDLVIGRLGQIYEPAKMKEDVVLLNKQFHTLTTTFASFESRLGSVEQELTKVKTELEDPEGQSIVVRETPEPDRAAKRRRLDRVAKPPTPGPGTTEAEKETNRRRSAAPPHGRLANGR